MLLIKRTFALIALCLVLAASAAAATITIASTTTAPATAYPGTTCTLRIYASTTFTASDGTVVMGSSVGSGSFYKVVSCTIAGGVITIPSFTIFSTTDAIDNQNATYIAVFYDSKGVKRDTFYANFRVPTTLGASISWSQLRLYNSASQPWRDTSVYTRTQTDQAIALALGGFGGVAAVKATTSIEGIARLSTEPADPDHPVVVETSDPRIPTQGENDALAGSAGTPSNSNRYVTTGDVSAIAAPNLIVRASGTALPNLTLNANNITGGTLADARLTANVPLLDNTSNQFVGYVGFRDTVPDPNVAIKVVQTGLTGGGLLGKYGISTSVSGTDAQIDGHIYGGGSFTGENSTAQNIADHNAVFGIRATGIFSGTGRTDSVIAAELVAKNINSGVTQDQYGSYTQLMNLGGVVGAAHGSYVDIVQTSTGDINSTANVFEGKYRHLGSGHALVVTGLKLDGWSKATSIVDTSYAIYIGASVDVGTTRYAIYSLSTSPSLLSGNLTVTGASGVFINSPTANLYLKDTSTGFQSSSATVVTPQANNAIRSTSYTSGLVGWNINAQGNAEFENALIRGELRASVFKVNEISATAGTFGVFYSASTLNADFTTPASISSTFTFDAKNSDISASAMLFGVGDVVRFKAYIGSSTVIGDAWATITARTNNTTHTTYTATLNNGSLSTTFRAGTAVVDYGPTATGFITLSTDGTVGSSPNMTMATHAGSPWSAFTTLLRQGNLNGSYGYATNIYGFGVGQYGTAASWLTVETTNGIRIGNNTTQLAQWDTSGNITVGETASGKPNIIITPTGLSLRTGTTVRTNLNGDGSGYLANSLISWDTSGNLTVSGNATIAGFSIGTDYVRDNANTTGLASTVSGGDDVRFWAGSTFANRATAPFRVTEAGNLVATNATISGAVTATSGSFTGSITSTSGTIGGWALAATSLTAGSGSTRVGIDSGGTNPAFYAGSATPGSAPFRVTNTGALTATNATITGAITATSGSFTGSITSTSGTIGGFTLGSDFIRDSGDSSGMASTVTGGDDVRFWTGAAFASRASAPFRVTEGGALVATSATITGAITATSGAINGALTMSGATSSIAIGTTPPTSASAGTGIWLDRTGMFGLASSVVQAKFDASNGAFVAAAGKIVLNADGIGIDNSNSIWGNRINWTATPGGAATSATGYVGNSRLTTTSFTYLNASTITDGNDTAQVQISARNDHGWDAQLVITMTGTADARGEVGTAYFTNIGGTFSGLQIGGIGTAFRSTTEGSNRLDIFNGTAPAGTLTNGISLYSTSGELRVMDAAGNATLLSPHDSVTNEWIFFSKNTVTGKVIRIDMERLMRALNAQLGGGFITEYMEQVVKQ